MFLPLKTAAGVFLTISKVVERVSANREELEERVDKLKAILLIVQKYKSHDGISALNHRIETFCGSCSQIIHNLLGNFLEITPGFAHRPRQNFRAFMTGQYLPDFSRAVLKDGQLYYLITVTSNLLLVGMFYDNHVAVTYRTLLADPNLMVTNTMVCHVFQNTKFGYHRRIATTSDLMSRTLEFIPTHRRPGKPQDAPANSLDVHVGKVPEEMVELDFLESHGGNSKKASRIYDGGFRSLEN
ncbi:hypothetical protein B0H13DRAFT_1881967 [Mycena leptocephala]|nr:hypothetical protein B0H13DRAFT_1881967 [Mycena leptocephala]